jgi:putative ABC transport system ATP-binding protein
MRKPRPLLSLRGVSKSFGESRAVLRGLDFDLAAGQYVAVMGESGVGKSTLLNLIAGLDRPDAGTIAFEGADLLGMDDDARTRLRRRSMGFVFQAFHVLPYLTVAQNVGLPLLLNGVAAAEASARVAAVLRGVGLDGRAESLPRELSGGETQRVAIARALVHRPRLVLADEPTGNLDPESAGQVLALLRERVSEEGCAGVLVTHSAAAARTADRIFVLGEGGLRPA